MKAITVFVILLTSIYSVCYAPSKRNLAAYNYSKVAEVVSSEEELDSELESFLNHLGKRESGGKWNIINKLGCKGKFQLSKIALKDIGYKGTTKEFLNDTTLQKKCTIKLMKKNKLYLKKYLKYVGKTVHGVTITLSGLLAGSHLAGNGSIQKFINSGHVAIDSNGTTVVKYMKEFSNYNLTI